jgi:hypothetical protein
VQSIARVNFSRNNLQNLIHAKGEMKFTIRVCTVSLCH